MFKDQVVGAGELAEENMRSVAVSRRTRRPGVRHMLIITALWEQIDREIKLKARVGCTAL